MFFEVYEFRFKYNGFYTFMVTSGFAITHVVVPGHCNEIFCFENILYFRGKWTSKLSTARVHHYTRYFPANGMKNLDVF